MCIFLSVVSGCSWPSSLSLSLSLSLSRRDSKCTVLPTYVLRQCSQRTTPAIPRAPVGIMGDGSGLVWGFLLLFLVAQLSEYQMKPA
jgi:hypothetical protein